MEPVIIIYQQEKKLKLDFILLEHIVRGRKINHVVLDKKIDEEESRLIQISLIGNEVRKTDNWLIKEEKKLKSKPAVSSPELTND